MEVKAALLMNQPAEWTVSTVLLDEPEFGEVLVEMVASGICRSDDHYATKDIALPVLPFCGGHEGGAVVRELGPGVTELEVGDHVITSFIPACGRCNWCASGMQQLCDRGASMLYGDQLDGTFRMHLSDKDVATAGMLGTFAEWQVLDQASCIRVPNEIPLESACIVGCGVPTGWGSATNGADVRPGDVVIVMGAGGVGMNAVQGAAHAGASHVIVVDPTQFKRDLAMTLGGTETFADIEEAADRARSLTNGQGADSAIITVDIIRPEYVTAALAAIRKAGTVVTTAQGAYQMESVDINLFEFTMYQKRLQGALYGMASPRAQVPALIKLYQEGILKLDEMVTRTYGLDDINEAFTDMRESRNLRGVIKF